MSERFSRAKWVILVAIILVGGVLYWQGANKQLTTVNIHMSTTDQKAFMNYARRMVETNYTFVGGRNRMPVYPFLQSLFYDPGMSEEIFFVQGKTRNLVLSMFLLVGIGMVIFRSFQWLHAVNLMFILAFTVFIFKAGFFQAQLLFFFLNFFLFLLMWRMLKKPSWFVAILTGIVAGIAHLTKASVLPGLVIFLVSLGIDWLLKFIRRDSMELRALMREKTFYYQPLYAILVVLVFLSVIFPYIRTSKRVFGQYFYNVNSTFYLWYDSWEEVKAGTGGHGDRVGWPDMPADEIPSMSKYLREHTARQIFDRFVNGAILITERAAYSYGYFKYLAIYALTLIVAMVRYKYRTLQLVRSNLALSIFLLSYFFAYFWLYAWFSPMLDGGNRLVLAQFIPLMFTISVGLHRLLSDSKTTLFSFQFNTLTLFNLAVLFLLVFNIHFILTEQISSMYGGF